MMPIFQPINGKPRGVNSKILLAGGTRYSLDEANNVISLGHRPCEEMDYWNYLDLQENERRVFKTIYPTLNDQAIDILVDYTLGEPIFREMVDGELRPNCNDLLGTCCCYSIRVDEETGDSFEEPADCLFLEKRACEIKQLDIGVNFPEAGVLYDKTEWRAKKNKDLPAQECDQCGKIYLIYCNANNLILEVVTVAEAIQIIQEYLDGDSDYTNLEWYNDWATANSVYKWKLKNSREVYICLDVFCWKVSSLCLTEGTPYYDSTTPVYIKSSNPFTGEIICEEVCLECLLQNSPETEYWLTEEECQDNATTTTTTTTPTPPPPPYEEYSPTL